MLARMWRKRNPSARLVGMQTGAATVEDRMEFPQKTKNGTAFWCSNVPLLGTYPKNPETPIQKNLCTSMFTAELSEIAKCWKQPKCPAVNEQSKTVVHLHDGLLCSRRKEYLPFATACMELGIIMLIEISQSVKNKYHNLTYERNLMNKIN